MRRIFYQTHLFSKKLDSRGGHELLLRIEAFYGKDETDDLSTEGKKMISLMVAAIKAEG